MSTVEPKSGGASMRPRVLTPERLAVWERAATHALCAVVPVCFTIYMLFHTIGLHSFALDFHNAFWPAGSRVVHGLSPYASPTSFAATHGFAFVYPAPGALLFAAFGWMPRTVADVIFTVICFAAALGTLAVLGVRDWRLYGLTLLWPAVISGWQTANVSILLALGIAIAWRFRDRPLVAGATLGLIVSLKLFLWPLAGWLLVTRRWRALAWTVVCAVVVNALAWGVLGWHQLSAYEHLVRAVTRVEETTAYTPLALALRLGAGHTLADAVVVVAAAACAFLGLRYARRGQEPAVLLMAITLSLVATPIVWRHYFVLFLVPLAITRPRLSAAWTIPLVLFFCPVTSPLLWQLALALGAMVVLVAVLLRWPAPLSFRALRTRGTEARGLATQPAWSRL